MAINAQLDRPHSVYYEGSTRTLYIADSGNHRVRSVQMDTGIISTILGTGNSGFNGDDMNPLEIQLNFPKYVVHSPGWGLFISDSNNHRVRWLNNSVVTTILGSGNSGSKIVTNNPTLTELTSPFGLFFEALASTLYVAGMFHMN